MAKFALLLAHAPDRYNNLSGEDYADIMKDYFAWVQARVEDGSYQGGHKLNTGPGRLLSSSGGALEVHDMPSAEIAEVVGGIMLIEASDMDAALALVGDHPHFKHNSTMMVFPVDPASED